MRYRTTDLFDRIQDNDVQLQPRIEVNMARITELTTNQILQKRPAKRRRPIGVYLLAAVLITFLMASTVFAYVGFTRYENPIQMLKVFYGNEEMESFAGGEVLRDEDDKPYTVVLPTIERVPLDEELAQEVTPPIAAVGQSVSWGDYTLTIVAHQHDKNLGAGTIYYTVENPNGVEGYDTQYNGELWWPGGEIMRLHGAGYENYLIPGETTATKLSVACYYHGTQWLEKYRDTDHIEMSFCNTDKTIQLPKYASEEDTKALLGENGEVLITAIGMELRLQDMLFLHSVQENGRSYPPTDISGITSLAVEFSGGDAYTVLKDTDSELIDNCAYISQYDDPVFGTVASFMFNRVIDINAVTGVRINDTVFPVEVCEDPSVRFEMLPKTEVLDMSKIQVVEITGTEAAQEVLP